MRRSTALVVASAVVVAAAGAYSAYLLHARFYLQAVGDGLVYKIDRFTGATWQIVDGQERPITRIAVPAPLAEAINLARTSPEGQRLELNVVSWAKSLDSPVRIVGWEARQFDEDRCIVSYKLIEAGRQRVAHFEVNRAVGLVREIRSPQMMKEYGVVEQEVLRFLSPEEIASQPNPFAGLGAGQERTRPGQGTEPRR